MHKREAEFCTDFQKWLKANHWGTSFPWEAKVVRPGENVLNYNGAFPMDKTTRGLNHELVNLHNAKHRCFCYKISDYDQMQKPFDGFFYTCGEAYVIVKWVRPGNKTFYVIDVDAIILEMNAGSKSLTEERAREISHKTGELK